MQGQRRRGWSKALYVTAGLSRQAYYQYRQRQHQRAVHAEAVLEQVRRIREVLPMTGVRKLWKELAGWRQQHGVKIGRNRLFEILRAAGWLIRRKRSAIRTTHSGHGFGIAPNRIKTLSVERADQVWVSDITYVRTRQGFAYVSLVSDGYSRAIIGWDVSQSLSIEGSLRALQRAMGPCEDLHGVIHHSDRGVQYCSGAYRACLASRGMLSSMAAVGNPYENAIAERINGILKQEFGLERTFATVTAVERAVAEAVVLYNTRRRHQSLGYQVPADVHAKSRSLNPLLVPYNPVNV